MFTVLELPNFGLCPAPNVSVMVLRLKEINCLETESTVIEQSPKRNSPSSGNVAFAPGTQFPVRG